jgi:hypothetical protein
MQNMPEKVPEQKDIGFKEKKLPDPNPVTRKRHHREMAWQVYVPLAVGLVIILILMGLTISGANNAVLKGGDVALIWLIAPALVLSLILLAINAAAIYGIAKLLRALPGYSRILLEYFLTAGIYVNKLSDRLVAPIFRVQTFNASLRQIGDSLNPRRK